MRERTSGAIDLAPLTQGLRVPLPSIPGQLVAPAPGERIASAAALLKDLRRI